MEEKVVEELFERLQKYVSNFKAQFQEYERIMLALNLSNDNNFEITEVQKQNVLQMFSKIITVLEKLTNSKKLDLNATACSIYHKTLRLYFVEYKIYNNINTEYLDKDFGRIYDVLEMVINGKQVNEKEIEELKVILKKFTNVRDFLQILKVGKISEISSDITNVVDKLNDFCHLTVSDENTEVLDHIERYCLDLQVFQENLIIPEGLKSYQLEIDTTYQEYAEAKVALLKSSSKS
jgi:hypothetical protein